MSARSLPDLLELLAEVFLVPGAFDAQAASELLDVTWLPAALRVSLGAMLAAPRLELDVAYAGLFLHGRTRPTIHLQASAQGYASSALEADLEDLQAILGAADLAPAGTIQADHLGALLALQAGLLRRAAAPDRGAVWETLNRRLLNRHLLATGKRVAAALAEPGVGSFYHAAGSSLAAVLELCTALC